MRRSIVPTLAALAFITVACGAAEDASDTATPPSTDTAATTTSASTTTSSVTTTTSASAMSTTVALLPDPIPTEGAPVVDVAERELGRWMVLGGPDWMAVGFGSLWVKRDDGTVMRIDPENGDVQAEIQLGAILCQGLGVGPESVWACTRDSRDVEASIARIDPDTNEVTDVYPVDKSSDQGRLVTVDDRLWVLSGGDRLVGIGSDGVVSEPIELGVHCTDLAGDGARLWATCASPGLVLRIDTESRTVTDRLHLAKAWAAAVGDHLWVGFQDGLAQIDPDTLDVVAVYDIHLGLGGAPFAAEDGVWVRTPGSPALTRIDPDARRVVEMIDDPAIPSGGDVVVVNGSVWITAYDDRALLRLSAG